MTQTQQVWLRDMNAVADKIAALGAVVTEDDGFQWIDTDVCGQALADLNMKLAQVGYARGWMA